VYLIRISLLIAQQRKLGLKDGGVGSHVDISAAWIDLSLLTQCDGKLREGICDFNLPSVIELIYLLAVINVSK